MLPSSLLPLLLLLIPSLGSEIDDTWRQFLETPPEEAVTRAEALTSRADTIAASLSSSPLNINLEDIDVVCSGGGNYDAFYMGVHMILDRVAANKGWNIHRHAGVSAGGMMPMEIALKSESTTLKSHLSYGVLSAQFADKYSGFLEASYLEDHHWRIMADWQTHTYADTLPSLDGSIIVGTSCLQPLPTLVLIDSWTAENDQATHAFMSTGTYIEMYDGSPCTDGGMTTGPKMTPLFQDEARPQLIVDLMATGFPSDMVYKVDLDQYEELIKIGMDEMEQFLESGTTEREAIITLCEIGEVDGFECSSQNRK
ncbi:hypothetical protein TeGR_g11156 [Tetraparma gracilis]|uniref:PNPLA domain-containing protein n=1 Tax=Tetraparma gracilis TaxID=2962635 RepID=A0ABQ6MQN1_9STRA|nr:hypothetical protein TeGR_g11156 [Tetraparma gracilis]